MSKSLEGGETTNAFGSNAAKPNAESKAARRKASLAEWGLLGAAGLVAAAAAVFTVSESQKRISDTSSLQSGLVSDQHDVAAEQLSTRRGLPPVSAHMGKKTL